MDSPHGLTLAERLKVKFLHDCNERRQRQCPPLSIKKKSAVAKTRRLYLREKDRFKGVGKMVSVVSVGARIPAKKTVRINCGNDCSENYERTCDSTAEGRQRCGLVYFKAVAEKGSTFGGWGGDCLTFKNEKTNAMSV